MFSVIIPTYNNINYLKLCLDSLKKNSKFSHEIILHVNEGIDGTLDYVKKNNFLYSYSEKNSGVCVAFKTTGRVVGSGDYWGWRDRLLFICRQNGARFGSINLSKSAILNS